MNRYLERVVCAAAGGVAALGCLWAAVAVSGRAHAGPDDILLTQRNSTDTANLQRIPAHPVSTWGLLAYDGAGSLLPSWLNIGAGLTINGSNLEAVATAPAWTDITGKPTFATVATSGAYADLTGKPTIPGAFNFSQPSAKTVSVSTSYQAADPTKAAVIYPSYACQNATQVLVSSACTAQVRMGTGTLTCSTGAVYYTQSLTVQLGVLLTQNSTNPVPIFLPVGASFIVCPTAGTFTITAVEQTAG